jgi:predicted nucleic acid-binding protein
MPVLDTTLLIGLERRLPVALRALERARQDGHLLAPAHAVLEYLSGMDNALAELHHLRDAFEVVHTDDSQVLRGAELRAQARRAGRDRPHWGDIHIAAVASLEGTYVVTTNKRHFAQLGVPAWNYESEPEPPA